MRFFQRISRIGLVLILFGTMMLTQSASDFILSFHTPKSFAEVLENGLSAGDRVRGQVPLLLDSFAYEQTWTESGGSRTAKKTSEYYYVLPAGDSFVGLTISAYNSAEADKLVEQTYDYLSGGAEPAAVVELDARVSEMEDDLISMFEEEMKEYYDYSSRELESMKPYLMVEPRSFTAVRVLCIGGAALILLGVFVFVRRWRTYSGAEISA